MHVYIVNSCPTPKHHATMHVRRFTCIYLLCALAFCLYTCVAAAAAVVVCRRENSQYWTWALSSMIEASKCECRHLVRVLCIQSITRTIIIGSDNECVICVFHEIRFSPHTHTSFLVAICVMQPHRSAEQQHEANKTVHLTLFSLLSLDRRTQYYYCLLWTLIHVFGE